MLVDVDNAWNEHFSGSLINGTASDDCVCEMIVKQSEGRSYRPIPLDLDESWDKKHFFSRTKMKIFASWRRKTSFSNDQRFSMQFCWTFRIRSIFLLTVPIKYTVLSYISQNFFRIEYLGHGRWQRAEPGHEYSSASEEHFCLLHQVEILKFWPWNRCFSRSFTSPMYFSLAVRIRNIFCLAVPIENMVKNWNRRGCSPNTANY